MANDCIFCRVVRGEIPAKIVRQDEHTVAFRDINPQAPTHVLVVPREHVSSIEAMDESHEALIGKLVGAAREIARREGVAESGYRLVINTGADGGQTVDHVHVHVLGGRSMHWPPG